MNLLKKAKPQLNPLVNQVNKLELPEVNEIIGSYRLNYNIETGHKIVQQAIQHKLKGIIELEASIDRLQTNLTNDLTRVEQLTIERNIKQLQDEINRRQKLKDEYLTRTHHLIEEFKMCPQPGMVEIGNDTIPSPDDYHRIDIIERWLRVASDYITIRMTRELAPTDCCIECEVRFEVQGNEVYCPSCFLLAPSSQIPAKFRDVYGGKVSGAKKNYNITENLRKTFLRIQGNSDVKIPYSDIEVAFDKHIKLFDLTKTELQRKDIINMMKMYHFTDYYLDVNLICHRYLGWKLPDWSMYEENVIKRYSKFMDIYDSIEKKRTSAINGQYVICKLLQIEGCENDSSYFKMTKGEDTIDEYERIWAEACIMLDSIEEPWPFHALDR